MRSKETYASFAMLFMAIGAYVYLGYFFERQNFANLFLVFTTLFAGFYLLIKNKSFDSKHLFFIGLVFRAVLLFSIPFLSQDFYRFIWDGQLVAMGISPYQYKPNEIINTIAQFPNAKELYQGMGGLSASHFSNYPPINQYIFAVTVWLSEKSILAAVIIFRFLIILADVGIFFFGKKILNYLKLDTNRIFWYFLNPLVIIELTGNLHFEGVMLFFLVLGFYFLSISKWIFAAIVIAASVSVKLLPLLLLPLFLPLLQWKKSVIFYMLIISTNLALFASFFSYNLVQNYMETIALWFVNFEFNASIYYIIREIGFYYKGYNIIETVGKIMPIVIIVMVFICTFFRKNNTLDNVITTSFIILTIYFFTATTVHPWYIINLIVLGVFTKYKFQLVWSFFIILSYYAYSVFPFKENMYLLVVEYVIVFYVFFLELYGESLKIINDVK
jgi:alpha-1,6-mannosyltransferase